MKLLLKLLNEPTTLRWQLLLLLAWVANALVWQKVQPVDLGILRDGLGWERSGLLRQGETEGHKA